MTSSALSRAALALSAAASGHRHLVSGTSGEGLTVEASGGRAALVERWRESTLSLLMDAGEGRVGFASAQLSPEGFDPAQVVERAVESASVLPPDPARALAGDIRPVRRRGLAIFDRSWSFARVDEAVALALRLERAALGVRGARSARKPAFEATREENLLLAGGLVVSSWRETGFSLQVEVAAGEEGEGESGWAAADRRSLADLDPEAVGGEAARRAVELLNSRPAPNGTFPALLDRRVAAEILELLGGALTADSHRKKTSFLLGKAGTAILPETLTIIDDGLLPGGPSTRPTDDEGTPQGRTVCVERGRLKALLYDRAEGTRAGVPSTGNGSSGSGQPLPAPTNLLIADGETPVRAMVSGIGRGLWVREVLGLHTADPVTGEFSVGCAGLWVEKGKVVHPVAGTMIAGDVLTLLGDVAAVGDDFAFTGACGSPSLLVSRLRVSGR